MSALLTLRAALRSQDLDGMIVTRADPYLGEYVPAAFERLAWLTGFTGSAGVAVVLAERAALLTDGRYLAQARREVNTKDWQITDSTKTTSADWIKAQAPAGARIGYDPWTISAQQAAGLAEKLVGHATLRPLSEHPIDPLWTDRPALPASTVFLFPDAVAGKTSTEKRADLAQALQAARVDACFLGVTESVMWLLNIRGADLPYAPFACSYACLWADGSCDVIIDPARVPKDVSVHLGSNVRLVPPDRLSSFLSDFRGKAVQMDSARANAVLVDQLKKSDAKIIEGKDPTVDPRACKTKTELDAMRAAHIKDGKALTHFLHWLADSKNVTELDELGVEKKLEEFRRQDPSYQGPSFATIAGAGPNGAIIHYRATPATHRVLEKGSLLLIDSGGQYHWGTTDVTRTVAIGTPTPQMQRHYTSVLKAHIALSRAVFPLGTKGVQLDALVRAKLWEEGLDFAHGTGHGVGCYLSVHEDAASLSPRGQEVLKPGMVLSNEPGFYLEGQYGIRIENLMVVVDLDRTMYDGTPLLGFETLTRVSYDARLILSGLLSADEHAWLAAYEKTATSSGAAVLKVIKGWING